MLNWYLINGKLVKLFLDFDLLVFVGVDVFDDACKLFLLNFGGLVDEGVYNVDVVVAGVNEYDIVESYHGLDILNDPGIDVVWRLDGELDIHESHVLEDFVFLVDLYDEDDSVLDELVDDLKHLVAVVVFELLGEEQEDGFGVSLNHIIKLVVFD